MFHRVFLLLFSVCSCINAAGFVFYPVGGGPLKWKVENGVAHTNVVNPVTKAVRYYIASDVYSAANREAEIAAVQACFDQWASVPGSALKFEFAGFVSPSRLDVRKDNTNVVFWAKQSLSVDSGRMNLSGIPAWTSVHFTQDGILVEGDIVLNGQQFQWFTDFNDAVNQGKFIEAVLLHEIGHFVGLDHAVAGGATLAIGASGVSPEAGLSADEIAAMNFLYSAAGLATAAIKGTVRLNGVGILGAAVIAEDVHGNLAGATVTRADGSYDLAGLLPGNYGVRVAPLDPENAGAEKLIRGADVAAEYRNAVTSFSATTNVTVSLVAGQIRTQDFSVRSGPAMRITSLSKPTTIPDLISVHRFAVTLVPGWNNVFVAVSGATLKAGSVLKITGDGVTVGPTTFLENRVGGTSHTLVTTASVSSNATPGLRSFVVTHGEDIAYANGFVEIATSSPDYNFDGLDDRFQRRYWQRWTVDEASPGNDPDADRFSNDFEYRTGSDPTNAQSFRLPIHSIARAGSSTTITLEADWGKRYQLFARRSLLSGSWETVGRPATAEGPRLTLTNAVSADAQFYRVSLVP